MEENNVCTRADCAFKNRSQGIYLLQPNDAPLISPESDKSKKKRMPKVFQLGNGSSTRDVEEAAEDFVKREFPKVHDSHGHAPIFVPEFFISDMPKLLDYDYKGKNLVQNERKWDAKPERTLGERTEFYIYHQLRDFFQKHADENTDVLVIHGWKCKWRDDKDQEHELEADFIIADGKNKTVTYVECKSSVNKAEKDSKVALGGTKKKLPKKNMFSKIVKQQWSTMECLQKTVTFGEGWKYVKTCAIFEPSLLDYVCDHCQGFMITGEKEDHFHRVWEKIGRGCLPSSQDSYRHRGEYVRLFKHLVFSMSVVFTKKPITIKEADDSLKTNLEKASAYENVLMWTGKQLAAFETTYKKVFLDSPFGTGKTMLLRQKAIQVEADLLKRRAGGELQEELSHAIFIILSCQADKCTNLLLEETRNHFANAGTARGIMVYSWKDVEEEVSAIHPNPLSRSESLTAFVAMHKNSAGIFVDEFLSSSLLKGDYVVERMIPALQRYFKKIRAFCFFVAMRPKVRQLVRGFIRELHRFVSERKNDILQIFHDILDNGILSDFANKVQEPDYIGALSELKKLHALFRTRNVTPAHIDQFLRLIADDPIKENMAILWNREESEQARRQIYDFQMRQGLPFLRARGTDTSDMVERYLDGLASMANNYLWIAVNKNDKVFRGEELLPKAFFKPHLSYNLRSAFEIVDLAEKAVEKRSRFGYRMSRKLRGRQPLVIRLSLTGPQLASQLTQAFARGLEHCRDVDDVFVTWDETSYRRLSVLTDAITNFCLERDIPVHVVKSATDQSFSSLARFRDTRKGILLSNMKFIQGCEFKSVIAFFVITDEKRRKVFYDKDHFSIVSDVILRAMCNFVAIDCDYERQ